MSRRGFCFGAAAVLAGAVAGCTQRVKVLKFPENADECADLFEFFGDPNFSFEEARTRLNIIGEPSLLAGSAGWVLTTYPKQNQMISRVGLAAIDGRLTAMYIYYAHSLEMSLRRLEARLGISKESSKIVVGTMAARISALTNTDSREGESNPHSTTSYRFAADMPPDPSAKGVNLLVDCFTTDNNLKQVNWLRYKRP